MEEVKNSGWKNPIDLEIVNAIQWKSPEPLNTYKENTCNYIFNGINTILILCVQIQTTIWKLPNCFHSLNEAVEQFYLSHWKIYFSFAPKSRRVHDGIIILQSVTSDYDRILTMLLGSSRNGRLDVTLFSIPTTSGTACQCNPEGCIVQHDQADSTRQP